MQITNCGRGVHKREVNGVGRFQAELPSPWYAFTNLDLALGVATAREVDIVIVADRQIFVIDIKDWYGDITSANGNWQLNGEDREASPVAKINGVARDIYILLKASLAKRVESKSLPVPQVIGLVVLTGKADRSGIAPTEIAKVLTLDKAVFRARGEHRYSIPEGSRWGDVLAASTNLGETLTQAMRAVSNANEELRGVFTVDWAHPAPDGSGKPLIPNEVVHALIQHFNAHDLSNASVPPDVLGHAYEYLIKQFADDAGAKAGEFFTPPEVVDTLVRILEPRPGEMEGTYFKQQMSKARLDGRIGLVPHDENRKVNTFWDIGNDATTIWFHQSDGVRHRLIDYYENAGEQIAHYCNVLQEKQTKRGFNYGRHYGPRDFGVTDWGGDGKTRKERAEALGIEIDIVPRVDDKADAIEEGRGFLNMCWIDTQHCQRGIQCLDNYRKEWDDARGVWRSKPLHDWASHGADPLMTGAMGFSPEPERRPEMDRHCRRSSPPRSAWAV